MKRRLKGLLIEDHSSVTMSVWLRLVSMTYRFMHLEWQLDVNDNYFQVKVTQLISVVISDLARVFAKKQKGWSHVRPSTGDPGWSREANRWQLEPGQAICLPTCQSVSVESLTLLIQINWVLNLDWIEALDKASNAGTRSAVPDPAREVRWCVQLLEWSAAFWECAWHSFLLMPLTVTDIFLQFHSCQVSPMSTDGSWRPSETR